MIKIRSYSCHPNQSQDAHLYLQKVLQPLCQVVPDFHRYNAANDVLNETNYSFYDSLMVAPARQAGYATLYSEDLRDGHSIDP